MSSPPKPRRRRRALQAGLTLTVGLLLFEAYARWPSSSRPTPLSLPAATREVVLIFHGTAGADHPDLHALERRFKELGAGREGRVVRLVRWSPHSDNIFRAASNGAVLGAALGRELAALGRLTSVRLVAHSAGAYVLDALCESYRAHASVAADVEMTFLDPIGTMGTWDYWYGYRNHGRCADQATAYINVDDPVPGTNAPLAHARNVDVTSSPERAAFDGELHDWPVRYYLRHLDANEATPRIGQRAAAAD